jgi:hypothetical protein
VGGPVLAGLLCGWSLVVGGWLVGCVWLAVGNRCWRLAAGGWWLALVGLCRCWLLCVLWGACGVLCGGWLWWCCLGFGWWG